MSNPQPAPSLQERPDNGQGFVNDKLPGSFAALAGELWIAASAGGARSAALSSVLGWRLEEAAEILDSELRQIKRRLTRVGEVEEAAGMVFRYVRAAEEGASQINLRIMAKAIRGLAAGGRPKASAFLRYADAVASLSVDEICAIYSLLDKTNELDRQGLTKDRDGKAWSLMIEDLVPRLFPDQQAVADTLLTASRTGLVTKAAPFKLGPFATTPLLHELASFASLDRAIVDEGIDY